MQRRFGNKNSNIHQANTKNKLSNISQIQFQIDYKNPFSDKLSKLTPFLLPL